MVKQLVGEQKTFDVIVTTEMVKQIIRIMHLLPEKDKLEVSKGLRNADSFIFGKTRYNISELMHGGGSGGVTPIVGTGSLYSVDLSAQATGTNMSFTIPAVDSIVALISSDAPFIYRPLIDFVAAGTTLIFTGTTPVPSLGATVILEYIPQNSGTAAVATFDLSPQCNGVTTVFTVPVVFSVLSLRGSDFPVVYRSAVDYFIAGTSLSLVGVPAPSLGSTLLLEYNVTNASASVADLSAQCNGVNTTFIIPAFTRAISLIGTDAPIAYRPSVDYTVGGTVLLLTGVNPPSAGATLLFTYVA